MPKRVFWPAAFITMGLIVIASLMGYLPAQFTMFWPIILIVVGLGGLLTADREDWMVLSAPAQKSRTSSAVTPKKSSVKSSKKAVRRK